MTEQPHASRAHARLAPSAAHRWISCAGSVRMAEAAGGSKGSTYAAEGTAAHELAAMCLKGGYDADKFLGWVVDVETSTIALFEEEPDNETTFEVDEEMVEGVQMYLDAVRSLIPKKGPYELDVEQRLDMTHIHDGIFGTGDTVLYQIAVGRLHVIDLKYGRGVAVEPEENPQLMLYGAGAARRYHNRVLNEVVLHIVQPRAPHPHGPIRSWQTDAITLMEFEDVLRERAAATQAPDAPLVAGEWCRFCPALATCPAARQKAFDSALSEFAEEDATPPAPEALNSEQIAAVLGEAEFIGNWVKAVQVYAHAEAVAGRCPPGYKLVPKRATRKWIDEKEAEETLFYAEGLSNDVIYTEPELKSPAQVEKAIGKKRFKAIEADLVVKVSSGTNLVPLSDVRSSVRTEAAVDFAD